MSEFSLTTKEEVFNLYADDIEDHEDRLVYPSANDATEEITEAFYKLRKDGRTITLVDGAFDVPQPNHLWYLRHVRALGAGALVESLGKEPTQANVRRALGSNALKLAVTVDADIKLSSKKGSLAAKGGVSRPIYPWQERAARVADYTYKTESGLYRPVADLVTVEGDSIHEGTALESSLTLAQHLHHEGLLDHFVVYGEHSKTVEEARELGVPLSVISDSINYAINPQTGKPYSSSSLIRRAQGEPVENPITRPVPVEPADTLLRAS